MKKISKNRCKVFMLSLSKGRRRVGSIEVEVSLARVKS